MTFSVLFPPFIETFFPSTAIKTYVVTGHQVRGHNVSSCGECRDFICISVKPQENIEDCFFNIGLCTLHPHGHKREFYQYM